MKKLFSSLFLLIALFSVISAQNKQLSLEDAVYNQYFSLAPEDLSQIQWVGNSADYDYIYSWSKIIVGNAKTKKEQTLCTLSEINKLLTSASLPTIDYLYDIKWLDNHTFYEVLDSLVFVYDTKNRKIVQSFVLPGNATSIFFNKNANAVAFTLDNNLQLMDKNGTILKISDESDKGIVYGSDYVHRQEFGIDHGIFWSPNGKFIAFYRKDETMVADYPLVDYSTFPATVNMIKYPMNGQTSEQVTLGIYNVETKQIVYCKTGESKDHYLTSITWDPTEKYIYIGILNRDQNYLNFNKYDISNGDFVKTLFEEKNTKYVEPLHPAYFLPTTTNQFIWQSQRDGYNHLYLYNTEGNLIKQVTKGEWVVTDYHGVSPDEKFVYFQSNAVCPTQRHAYKVEIKSGKMTQLCLEEGMHSSVFSDDKSMFIDVYSNIKTPRIINIDDNNGKQVSQLLDAENPLKSYKLGAVKFGILKAADGLTDLYYRLILPVDFDSTKKYPVVVYLYGGPHDQLVNDEWVNGGLWNYYMAQKGYIMFTIDNRGSEARGFEFESATFRHLGVNEMKDQLEGIKFLKSKTYVDSTRIGVHGWSFGGFMTISLMTTYPNIFKVAVAGGPVIDWKYYEVMYGERYMDTPQSNPDGFKETSILNKIGNLKGKLLVINGNLDNTVVPQHQQQLLIEAQKKNVQIDYYDYPTSEHNVRGRLRIHLMQKITQYFDDNL